MAVLFDTIRYPLAYVGDDRIIGALEMPQSVLLLINLGMVVALLFVTLTNPVQYRVVWSGVGSQVPELDRNLQPVARTSVPATPPRAPIPAAPAVSRPLVDTLPGATPRATPTSTPADKTSPGGPSLVETHPPAALSGSPRPSATPASPAPSTALDPPTPRDVSPVDGRPTTTIAPTVEPGPSDLPRASATSPADNEAAERSGPATTVLSPIALSEEVTTMLVRHLRHAATLLPIAKGAEVARQWLLALERACGDMSGIGDVVGGSGVLFATLHEGGHVAVMPSAVSASAAAKLLVVVTPLVEQVSRRRWALRVSALLDPQSVIFRKLARRAPATCRLATNAPPAPAPTGRVRKPGAGRPDGTPARKNRTAELAAQLTAANAELERLRADVAELRRAVVSPGRDPAATTSTGAACDDKTSA